jgi:hypothetical protein
MHGKSIFFVLLAVLIVLELISAALAYATLGEVFRTLYGALIALNPARSGLIFKGDVNCTRNRPYFDARRQSS